MLIRQDFLNPNLSYLIQGMCIISAGSLTVDEPTSCSGVGGRSRELALSAAIELDALKRSCNSSLWYKDVEIAFLCMATDGVDGPDQQVAGESILTLICALRERGMLAARPMCISAFRTEIMKPIFRKRYLWKTS